MKMRDFLATIVSRVGNKTIATFETFRGSDFRRDHDTSANDRLILVAQIRQRDDLLFWNHEKMNRSSWIDIAERHAQFIVVQHIRRNLARNDLGEDARHVIGPLNSFVRLSSRRKRGVHNNRFPGGFETGNRCSGRSRKSSKLRDHGSTLANAAGQGNLRLAQRV